MTPTSPRPGDRLLLVGLAAALILVTTMPPTEARVPANPWLCVVCGEAGAANAIRNVALFAPLGAALVWSGVVPAVAVVAGAGFSFVIESVQLWIPGRTATPGDLLFNTLGTGAGIVLLRAVPHMQRSGAAATALGAGTLAGALAVVVATALLLQPLYPRAPYFGGWATFPGDLGPFHGWVLNARLDTRPLPAEPRSASEWVRDRLMAGGRLEVSTLLPGSTAEYAPLLVVGDARQRHALEIGSVETDVIIRFRRAAAAVRLVKPDHVLTAALAQVPGTDTVHIAVWREEHAHCAQVQRRRWCGLGYTLGRGWSLLLGANGMPAWFARALDLSWLVVLGLPVGASAPNRAFALVGGTSLLLVLLLVPYSAGLLTTTPLEFVATAAGLVVGRYVRSVLLAVQAPDPPPTRDAGQHPEGESGQT